MTNLKQALPPDDPAYSTIRDAARGLAYVVDELTFEPLYEKHTKVLSLVAVISQEWDEDIWLTAWKGFRDGRGKDGSPLGFWVRADESMPGTDDAGIVPLDPEHPAGGLQHPPEMTGKVRRAVSAMYELLLAAERTHAGLVGLARLRSFTQLNEAVAEGLEDGYEYDEEVGLDPVEELEELCAESEFASFEFGPRAPGPDPFASTGVLVIDGIPVEMTVWSGPSGQGDDRVRLKLAGRIQMLPRPGAGDPEVQWPDEDEGTNEWLASACEELVEIHRTAAAIFKDITSGGPDSAYALLSAAAAGAADDGFGDGLAFGDFLAGLQEVATEHDGEPGREAHAEHDHDDPNHRAWQCSVDSFTQQCRYGWLYGITVDLSPHGGVDVAALIRPPGLEDKGMMPVRVFMHQGELETEPGHWFGAADVMCPAHAKDVDIVGLVSVFPIESQGFIAHALQHLHTMNHTVEDILKGKLDEIVDALELMGGTVEDLAQMSRVLYTRELPDILSGLNGIARLHTGSFPQPKD